MELYLERGDNWFSLEIKISREIAYISLSVYWGKYEVYRSWSPMVACPACFGIRCYGADAYYSDKCPVCPEEGHVWPTGWLRFKVWQIIARLIFPYRLWVDRPTHDFDMYLMNECIDQNYPPTGDA